MFHSYFERKYDKVFTFNIVHFSNFEISAPCNKRRTQHFQNLQALGALIRGNMVIYKR